MTNLLRKIFSSKVPESRDGRKMALITILASVGSGLYFTVLPLFLVREVHFPPAHVGFGISIGGAAGACAGMFVGHLGDRVGLRRVLITMCMLQAGAAGMLRFVDAFIQFTLTVSLAMASYEGARAVRYAIIARLGGEQRVTLRAQLRVMTNVGMAMGAAAGGFAVQLDSPASYSAALGAIAVFFILAGIVSATLPRMAPISVLGGDTPTGHNRAARQKHQTWTTALADLPYVTVAGLNGVLFLETQILTLAIPLWIVTRGVAPRWVAGAAFVINAFMVIFLQVRATRTVTTALSASQVWQRAGLAFLIACGLLAATARAPAVIAMGLILVAVVAHGFGELWHMAGSFELSLTLAPDHAQGLYQGTYNIGEGIAAALGPALVTILCIDWGPAGWIVLGCVLLVCGQLARPVVGWASKSRSSIVTLTTGSTTS